MYLLSVYLILLPFFVYGSSDRSVNYDLYKSINKENIRNSLHVSVNSAMKGASNNDDEIKNSTIKADNINKVIKNITDKFLPKFLKLDLDNECMKISLDIPKEEGRALARKMSTKMSNLMQYMLVPSFLMAGILPWVMPKLQMVVMMVSMVNSMIFSRALFSLIRSYVFEQQPDEHVIYINHGYRNKPQHRYEGH